MQSFFCRPAWCLLLALFSSGSFVHFAQAQTGPGGVGNSANNVLWLSADFGVYSDAGATPAANGANVQQWNDRSGNGNHASVAASGNRPNYQVSQLNGLPSLLFTAANADRLMAPGVGSGNRASVWIVARYASLPSPNPGLIQAWPTGASQDFPSAGADKTIGIWISRNSPYRIWGRGVQSNNSQVNLPEIIPTDPNTPYMISNIYGVSTINQYVNGDASGSVAYNGTLKDWSQFGIGRQATESWNGDIFEVIVFTAELNAAQRIIIDNYLAAKYGFALAANDLYTMDDPGNGNYDHEVAGVGRVDASNLQNDSRGSGIVRVLNPGSFNNGDYFFWGHDNGAMSTQTTDAPAGIERYTRVWRGQEVGSITDLDIDFDLTGLGSVAADQLRLLIDTDNDGQFEDEMPISGATSLGSNRYRFSDVTGLTAAASTTRRFALGIKSDNAPGGVSSNLVWWLKADAGTYNSSSLAAAHGEEVNIWLDQSATLNYASNPSSTTRPLFSTDVINGYPALEFNGTKFLDATGPMGIGGTEDFIIFMVFKQNAYTPGGTGDGLGTFIIDRPTATTNLASFKVVNTNKYYYQRRTDGNTDLGGPVSVTPVNTQDFVLIDYYRYLNGASSTEGIYINGRLDVTTSGPTASMVPPPLRIGKHATNPPGGLNGYFAEIVVYNRELSDTDRQRVESYLALKYGITLDASVNYLRSGGSSIYPSTSTHAAYTHDIAGIAQDNSSGLYQPTSRSQNVGNMITISNPSALQENRFLVWGHNNGDLTTPTSADVGGNIELRLSRVWRVRTTGGSLGTVSVTVDMSFVPGPETAADLRLLVDTDGNFVNATEYAVSSSSGDLYTFDNVNLGNDNYFTIGTVDMYNTTLPVELTSFDVTYEAPVVVASWETASELNNDYFTLERAGEDMNFEVIARQPGAGTTSVPHTYTAIDPHPFGGRSYYRLKQTDYDGTSTYSPLRSVRIDETGRELVLFPNPNDGRQFTLTLGNTVFRLDEVEVINNLGVTVEKRVVNQSNLRDYQLQLDQALAAGIYLVRIGYNGTSRTLRLVVR